MTNLPNYAARLLADAGCTDVYETVQGATGKYKPGQSDIVADISICFVFDFGNDFMYLLSCEGKTDTRRFYYEQQHTTDLEGLRLTLQHFIEQCIGFNDGCGTMWDYLLDGKMRSEYVQ